MKGTSPSQASRTLLGLRCGLTIDTFESCAMWVEKEFLRSNLEVSGLRSISRRSDLLPG